MLARLRSVLELPLLNRELIELAQRKRTYVLRCVCLLAFSLVFLTLYVELNSRAVNLMWMLGQGREMSAVLFITLMVTIYVLAPAMACAAITSEKEKQTLGLLLISRLTPHGIVVEKICSRMLPLISLVIVAAPLFGLAYLFGGISFRDTSLGLMILLFTIFQVTAIAVFCSAVLETGIAAFWVTYLILAVLYFTWPILVALHVLPRPDFLRSLGEEEFLLFPGYQLAMLVDTPRSWMGVAILTIPQLIETLLFAVAARFGVVWFSYGAAFSLGRQWLRLQAYAIRPLAERFHGSKVGDEVGCLVAEADSLPVEQVSKDLPGLQPISWKEKRRSRLNRPWMLLSFWVALFLLQWWVLESNSNGVASDFCTLFSFVFLIVAVLLVLSQTCRLFGREREQQTLDALLATPLNNFEILKQKRSGINRLILLLLIPVMGTCFFNVFYTTVRICSLTHSSASDAHYLHYGSQSVARIGTVHWFCASALYVTCALGNAFIYMHLAKWIALFLGLKLKTQMKAMVGSLISVLVLCLVPLLLGALILMSADMDPDDFPLWFYMSPLIPTGMNEFHDRHELYRNNSMPDSDVFVVFFHFMVYGGLTLIVRTSLMRRLPELLQRRDQSTGGIVSDDEPGSCRTS
ncbi:MAG: ABC transporter permease subunit [Fuerstiella sp.]|nr:ABC transporter permease subunit [Fuerstiella sp.]